MTQRSTIEQIEALLKDDEPPPITILPDGTIRELTREEIEERAAEHPRTPLTFRQSLGGEY